MSFRRIMPRRPRQPSPETLLQNEILQLQYTLRRQTLELLDAINDVATPSPSDDEEEDEVEQVAQDPQFAQLLNPPLTPAPETSYRELYYYPWYIELVKAKLEKVKKQVSREDYQNVLETEGYQTEMARLRESFPEDGGRVHLYQLLALFNYFNNQSIEDSDEEPQQQP